MGVTLRAWLVVTLLAAPRLRSQLHGIGVVAAWDDGEEDLDLDLDFESVGAAPVEDHVHEYDHAHIESDDVVDEEELDLVRVNPGRIRSDAHGKGRAMGWDGWAC
jgi:hypothetical protein